MNLTLNILQDNGVGSSPTPLNILAGGIVINGVSNGSTVNSFGATVTDNTNAVISVSLSGFHTFYTTINNVYSTNATIDIILVPNITDILDPDYNRSVARFFSFIRPCGLEVDVYNASSFSGEVSYYLNNEIVSEGKDAVIKLCGPGNYQIKQRTISYQYVPGCPRVVLWDRQWATVSGEETGNTIPLVIDDLAVYLALDTETNIEIFDYRPSFVVNVASTVGKLEDYCCYLLGETLNIIPEIVINKVGATTNDYNFYYKIESPSSEVLFEETDLLTDITFPIEFITSELGVYKATLSLTDIACETTFTKELNIATCNFIVISSETCGDFVISNKSEATVVTVNVDNITGVNVLSDIVLEGHQDLNITFEEISLYTVTVQYEKNEEVVTEIYIINNYCSIEDCIGNYILDIICNEVDRCNPCPNETELNQMLLLNYSYFMKLNKEYAYNNFYSGLDQGKLDELTSLKQIMDKLVEFCSRRGCLSSSFNSTITNTPYTLTSSVSTCKSCGN